MLFRLLLQLHSFFSIYEYQSTGKLFSLETFKMQLILSETVSTLLSCYRIVCIINKPKA